MIRQIQGAMIAILLMMVFAYAILSIIGPLFPLILVLFAMTFVYKAIFRKPW